MGIKFDKYYTGIGSRKLPLSMCHKVTSIARFLRKAGWILRSGGADGTDSAFEIGARNKCQIFLPWDGFNGRHSKFDKPLPYASVIASQVHPNWSAMTRPGQLLHSRNAHQVLGPKLDHPSKLTICWTPGGLDSGGTRTGIILSRKHNIPTFNIFNGIEQLQSHLAQFNIFLDM
jgi:hypothetical protein